MNKYNFLLKQIQNPGQYIDSEKNSQYHSIKQKYLKNNCIKICLSYPDKYVIGMSNLGIEILYKLLNSQENILCERVFAPDIDLELLLKKENITWFSLETKNELKNFDLIGFSLQSELCYTNVFTILNLGKIEFKSSNRKKFFPLITAGGICTSNPYVLSDYIDFFILGEAEDSILKVVNIINRYKNILKTKNFVLEDEFVLKKNFLEEINLFKEIFVPNTLNLDKKIFPSKTDLKNSFYPTNPTVPNIRTTQQRLNIELSRGCAYNCNFCQATYISKPLRIRPVDVVEKIIEDGILSTGYNEISFTGFCVTNYPKLTALIKNTKEKFKHKNVFINLPSLRINDISEELLMLLIEPKRASITLAPETGNENLRRLINKNISDNEIFEKIKLLNKYGFKKIKLYFMIGLPGETMDDVDSIVKMTKKLSQLFPKINFTVTISPFVPRPHTTFQFSAINSIKDLEYKMNYLKKNICVQIRKNNIYASIIESLIARGDKNIGVLVENSWLEGAKFDNWEEKFNYNIWFNNIKKLNINIEDYIFKNKTDLDNFVWDNIIYSNTKKSLYEKYIKILDLKQNTKLFWNQYFEKPKEVFISKPKFQTEINNINKQTFRYRIKFSKQGNAIFCSHLDQLEIIKRTIKMSNLKPAYTNGFHPEIKLELGLPTPIGYFSTSEFLDIELIEEIDLNNTDLNKLLPEGFTILQIYKITSTTQKLSTVNLVEYEIFSEVKFDLNKLTDFTKTEISILKKNNKEINIKEIVHKISLSQDKDNNNFLDKHFALTLFLNLIPTKNLKPEVILEKIFGLNQNEILQFEILRKNLYIRNLNELIKI